MNDVEWNAFTWNGLSTGTRRGPTHFSSSSRWRGPDDNQSSAVPIRPSRMWIPSLLNLFLVESRWTVRGGGSDLWRD